MEIGKVKEYFVLGLVTGATVRAPDIINKGWTVEFSGKIEQIDPTLHTAKGAVRAFKTLDAVAKAMREIGLREWRVVAD